MSSSGSLSRWREFDRAHGLRADIAVSRIGPEYWDIDEVCLSGRIHGATGSRLTVTDDPTEIGSVMAEVILTARSTSDATTRFLPFVRNLKSLDASSTNISDVGLIEIGKQKNLSRLEAGWNTSNRRGISASARFVRVATFIVVRRTVRGPTIQRPGRRPSAIQCR